MDLNNEYFAAQRKCKIETYVKKHRSILGPQECKKMHQNKEEKVKTECIVMLCRIIPTDSAPADSIPARNFLWIPPLQPGWKIKKKCFFLHALSKKCSTLKWMFYFVSQTDKISIWHAGIQSTGYDLTQHHKWIFSEIY